MTTIKEMTVIAFYARAPVYKFHYMVDSFNEAIENVAKIRLAALLDKDWFYWSVQVSTENIATVMRAIRTQFGNVTCMVGSEPEWDAT